MRRLNFMVMYLNHSTILFWIHIWVVRIQKQENIIIKHGGQHKDYFKSFFFDSFYNQKEKNLKDAIPRFLDDVFDVDKPFSKSDLDILTELYKLLEKNIELEKA